MEDQDGRHAADASRPERRTAYNKEHLEAAALKNNQNNMPTITRDTVKASIAPL